MKRKIVINNCFDCPYCINKTKYNKIKLICMNPETKGEDIKDQDRIANFCDLEYEE